MFDFDKLAALPLFRNSALDWLVAAAIVAGALLVLLLVRRLVRSYHRRMMATAETELLEIPMQVLSRTTLLFFVALALFLGAQWLTKGPATERVIGSALTIALFWQAGVWAVEATGAWLDRKRRRSMTTDRAAVGWVSSASF
jgi:phosphatidylglycerophosphate synthase